MITQYLKENKDLLGINRIEFHDNSHFRCPENRNISIQLELSRQLEGQYPYYVQFGYIPAHKSSRLKLMRNRQKMSQYKTSDYPLKELCGGRCPPDLLEYVEQHQTQPLSETLRYISRHYCQIYGKFYRTIFDDCGLHELNSPIYHMRL